MELIFEERFKIDIEKLKKLNVKNVEKVYHLIQDILTNGPLKGNGKPEALKHDLSGCFSRRIVDEHRLIYFIDIDGNLNLVSCYGHYS